MTAIQWIAARLPDWVDHTYAIFHPGWNPVWGSQEPRGVAAAGLGTPPPALHLPLLVTCPTCGSGINQMCTTADGKTTRPHKARRQP